MSIPMRAHKNSASNKSEEISSYNTAGVRAGIPILVGATGHRNLRKQDVPKLRELVLAELQKLREKCPNSPVVMLSSLAQGADQLCAGAALELGLPLIAVLPLEIEEYRKDFNGQALLEFDRLCASAEEVFTAPETEEGAAGSRDYRYRQAGIYIASHSHVLLALWDGNPGTQGGCGTAETAGFMLDLNYTGKNGSFFKADSDGAVIHIVTPRQNGPEPENSLTSRLIENVGGSLDTALFATDTFNKDAATADTGRSYPLIGGDTLLFAGKGVMRLHDIYEKADSLSIVFRDKYLSNLKLISIFGICLVLAFLLYDELESDLFLPLYGVILIISFVSLRLAQRGSWHKKYLEYRALAETLRVQFYLSVSGICYNICDGFVWSQKNEIVWIKEASSALLVGPPPGVTAAPEKIKEAWIDSQLDYHIKKRSTIAASIRISSGWTNAMLAASVVMFAIICLMEAFVPASMSSVIPDGSFQNILLMHEGQQIVLRGAFKIILGVISAIALFLSNYYGKLSLERRISDNEKMAALYLAAQRKWDEPGTRRELIMVELAREEVVENGFWLSYSRDNKPDISI